MKKTGAWLVRHALEQIGVSHTFGIPGVHNTEIYDELAKSDTIRPVLVTHEGWGAFMADAISRTSAHIGCLVVVPAAGLTHASSGIGEAGLDGIPMLVISGGIRTDSPFRYQLHDIDQHTLMKPLTKATFRIERHDDIVDTVFRAYHIATSGEPGPVYIEVPVNISLYASEVGELPRFLPAPPRPPLNTDAIAQAARLLMRSQRPGIFLGWGAVHASQRAIALAERLGAPVATTLQGLSAFPASHPLHTGMGIGGYAVPASTEAFADCDCLLAVGTRFSEICTGSFGITPPKNLIHVDINPAVFNANYPAAVSIEGDSLEILTLLLENLSRMGVRKHGEAMQATIARNKRAYQQEWLRHDSGSRVNPAVFFQALRQHLPADAIVVTDDGNHTFLTAELMPILRPRGFISPTDFNCMGYCIPAAIGAKLANPETPVVGVVGDGALLMSGLELATASTQGAGCVLFVFSDGELSQISQAQVLPYNRKTCTVLPRIKVAGIALATGAEFLAIDSNADVESVITRALALSRSGRPVLVDVNIDYSKSTRFTQGIMATNLKRIGTRDKIRIVSRAVVRKVTG